MKSAGRAEEHGEGRRTSNVIVGPSPLRGSTSGRASGGNAPERKGAEDRWSRRPSGPKPCVEPPAISHVYQNHRPERVQHRPPGLDWKERHQPVLKAAKPGKD